MTKLGWLSRSWTARILFNCAVEPGHRAGDVPLAGGGNLAVSWHG